MAYYESGDHSPSAEVGERLAKVLNVPSAFFTGPPIDTMPAQSVSFRALSKISAVRRDSALASGALAVELNRWLEERLHLPSPDIPRYERAAGDCESAAQRLRFEWDLGYRKVPNMIHLMESHGARIFSLPEHLTDVDAFSFWWKGVPFVLLNPRKSGERGRFDAAHELAHLVIHSDYDLPGGREREFEANRFAAAFLMPEEDVLASGLRNAGPSRVIAAKHRWGVAAMALTHRLHELALTSDWTYTSTCRRLSELGYRSGERDAGAIRRESSLLLEKAFRILRERGIRQRDVARELHVYPGTLRELLFGLLITSLDGDGAMDGGTRRELRLIDGGIDA
jgi:Zn-dependent peptidase ImmA (M78 family)